MEQEMRNREKGTRKGTGNKEQGTRNKEQGTRKGTGNKEQSTISS